ncbi:MAG TPA: zinc ribbon domain-containing protein [Candidatus Gallacutalibacter pullistercoris]|nr:zinc ribbon domain-containing protein [Candidatus Gallacutalibacter pullistercoris]
MGLFEDVVVNAKSAANVVGKKAGQLMDISKLRLSAADVNREIAKRLEALGRTVYDAQKSGYDPAELVAESVSCIDELYEQLDVINQELAMARNKLTCQACGALNPQESIYCSRCGAKLVKEEPEEAPFEAEDVPQEPAAEEPAVPEESAEDDKPTDAPDA